MSSPFELLIEACGLQKNYGATQAVQKVSFGVKRGQVVGFLGPNGAGKSTTMKMLTGYLKPSAGMARIGGVAVAHDPLRARNMLGYLPENAPLYEDMMVIDFLRFIAEIRGIDGKKQAARLREVASRCGLHEVLGKDIAQLSKGYRQRVGLAQALVHDPDLLILDEPTSGLDPNQIVEIRALIRDLGQDKTVLLSTHILPEVQAVCGRVLIISRGQLVADDSPEHLGHSDASQKVHIAIKSAHAEVFNKDSVANLARQLMDVTSVRSVSSVEGAHHECAFVVRGGDSKTDLREALFQTAVANDWRVVNLHQQAATLEETFQRLTQKDVDKQKGVVDQGADVQESQHAA